MTKKQALRSIEIVANRKKKFKNFQELAAEAIMDDLSDRRGFKGIISDLNYNDPTIIREIKKTWSYIIIAALERNLSDNAIKLD